MGAILLGLALVSSPAFAKDWIYCRSAHFEGYREVEEAAGVSCDLDKWEAYWYFFSFVYGPIAEKDRLVRVVIFHHISGREGSDSPVGRGDALFVRSQAKDYLVFRESERLPYVPFTDFPGHEPGQIRPYTEPRNDIRAYIRLRLGEFSLPTWFAGGLESFYIGMDRREGKLFLADVDEVDYPAIDKLLAATSGTPKTMGVTAFGERRHRYRAKAKSLASMLHTHPDYHDRYREIFSMLAGGASGEEALQRVYGKSPEQVDSDLREYRETKPSGRFSTPVRPESTPATARPVTAAEETEMLRDLRAALETGQVERFK